MSNIYDIPNTPFHKRTTSVANIYLLRAQNNGQLAWRAGKAELVGHAPNWNCFRATESLLLLLLLTTCLVG